MNSFEIRTLLLYNPTLKPANRKALQDEIQDTKILYYSPKSSQIQQKRFHVGMAEGTYSFLDSMLSQDQPSPRYQIIHTKSQIYINKEVEENIWLFFGLRKSNENIYSNQKENYLGEETHKYDDEIFTEEICLNIVNHYYQNFRTFNGTIRALVRERENLDLLEKVMSEYLTRYIYLNQNKNTKKLEISFYQFQGLRMVPLDPNYCLKFNYFHGCCKNFDPSIAETLIFFNGYVVFTSLSPELTLLFYNYYYSLGQPFQFDQYKLLKKFSHLNNHNQLTQCRYGYFINSQKYGYEKKADKKSLELNQDLLGLDEQDVVNGIEIFVPGENKKELVKYHLTTFLEKKLLFVSLSSTPRSIDKVHLHNKLIRDNVQRYFKKIESIIVPLSNQFYRFFYLNLSTMGGKMTFSLTDTEVHQSLKRMLIQMKKKPQISLLHYVGGVSIYGLRRLSRIAILIMSQDIPIHRIEQNFERLSKNYFSTIYI